MNRLIIQYFLRRLLWWALTIIPIASAVIWTLQPAVQAYVTTLRVDPIVIEDADWHESTPLFHARRRIQQSLLAYDFYVPMNDILPGVPPQSTGVPGSPASLFMQKACGPSIIYVWIPLKFRLPLYGELVKEWCWKPPVTKK